MVSAAGQALLDLGSRWSDGTPHLLFDPVELLERLAALTPRPRINLVLYYGVLGARATWRTKVVPKPTTDTEPCAATGSPRHAAIAGPT